MESKIKEELYEMIKFQNSCLPTPSIVFNDYPDLIKHHITLREFKNGYLNKDEEVAGNLYSWIHQSFSVLWEVNEESNEIIIIRKTNEKLGIRFATLIKIDKDLAIQEVFRLSASLALLELIWLSNNDNNMIANTLGLKRVFLFNNSHGVIESNLDRVKIFNTFKRLFVTDNSIIST